VASLGGDRVRGLLLDVEGTTTPVSFVYDVLFPYARAHVREFLRRAVDQPAVRDDVAQLYKEHKTDKSQGIAVPEWDATSPDSVLESAAAYALFLMAADRKATGLKSLQGQIWREGYASGAIRGQVYPDVPPAFARWQRQGRTIAVFSSGSVLAQRLLFSTTPAGDLTGHIRAHFDTSVGAKREAASYGRIVGEMGLVPEQVLFLSDTPAELDAARAAGLGTALCVREGDPPAAPSHPVVRTFETVCPT
jgi:enolase-phosphatase E1